MSKNFKITEDLKVRVLQLLLELPAKNSMQLINEMAALEELKEVIHEELPK